jgi:hypothetical protein
MSYENEDVTRKLDRILILIEGDGENAPGLNGRVSKLEGAVFGGEQAMGLLTRTMIMWRVHVWMLCTLSAGAALLAREVVRYIWKV